MEYSAYINENIAVIIGIIVLAPIVITAVMTFFKLSQMKTARRENYAANYIDKGSFCLTESRDIFLYSHVTKIPKPQPNNKN